MYGANQGNAYVFIAVITVAVLAAIGVVLYMCYWYLSNWFSRTLTVKAVVVRKKVKQWDALSFIEESDLTSPSTGVAGPFKRMLSGIADSVGLSDRSLTSGTNYFVTFSYNGTEGEFAVPEESYLNAEQGMEGTLVYRGQQFNNFTPHSHVNRPDEITILR